MEFLGEFYFLWHYGKEEEKRVLGGLLEAEYCHNLCDNSTNTNTIVQQRMTFAISSSWKVFLAPDVELRQGEKKNFPILL